MYFLTFVDMYYIIINIYYNILLLDLDKSQLARHYKCSDEENLNFELIPNKIVLVALVENKTQQSTYEILITNLAFKKGHFNCKICLLYSI